MQNKLLPWHDPRNWVLYATEVGDLRLLEIYRHKVDLNTVEDEGKSLIDLATRKQQWDVVRFLNTLNVK